MFIRDTVRLLLLIGLIVVSGAQTAVAERYLTVTEALKLCFPNADRFDEQVIRFVPAEVKAIEKLSGTKVRNKGNQIRIAWQGTNMLGVLLIDHVLGKHEIIDYAVAVDPNGKVRQVEILEYRESHGYEIRGPKWREQFKGKHAKSRLKLNEDIYNISGATISCRHVTEGIKRVLATYELVVRPRIASPGSVPNPF